MTSPATVPTPIGVPSTGQDASAVTAGTTKRRLLAAVAPWRRISANSSRGEPTPVTSASQPKAPSAWPVGGIATDPASGAQTASTTAPAATSTAAVAAWPASVRIRACSPVPQTSPARPTSAHSSVPTDGGRPTRSARVTATPTTPSATPDHCTAESRSQPASAPIVATTSGAEQVISAVVPAGSPSDIA